MASLVVLVPSCADTITGPRVPVPGERTLDLDAGSWTIYQRVPAPIVVGPDRITVDGPRPVDLRTGGMRETVTINEVEYVSRARMEIEVSGRYTVSVSAPGEPSARTSELLITRGLGSFFSQWPWMVALVGGSLALPFGLTRWLRRSRPGHARSLRRSRRRT